MLQSIRRVVTGHNKEGKSIIASDGPSPHRLSALESPAYGLTNLWVTDSTPADNADPADAAARPVVLEPPASGSIFRVVEFPPDISIARAGLDREAVFAALSASDALDRNNPRHPGMHKTNTVDYAIVISGEIYAMMDEGETLLKAGDCLVQRGTNHSWSNRSDKPCLVAFVLIAANQV